VGPHSDDWIEGLALSVYSVPPRLQPPSLPYLMPICKLPSGAAVSFMHFVISVRVYAFSPDNSHNFSSLFFGISYLKKRTKKAAADPC
jgi:hypothetical protein